MDEVKKVVQNQIKVRANQKSDVKTFISSLLGSKRDGVSSETKAALELDAHYALKRFLKSKTKNDP
jgi:hypothetical protein